MSKLNEYESLIATVETGSLGRAAKQLNCSPSTISKQLSALETSLGVTLLERSNRTVEVTEAGRQFYTRCKEILAQIRDAESEVVTRRDRHEGKIALTITTPLARSPLMSLLAEFGGLHPNIRFDLQMTDELEDLVGGRLDFALRLGNLADNRLHAVPLLDVRPVFCASPDYLQLNGEPQQLSDLREHRIGLLSTVNLANALQNLSNGKAKLPKSLDIYDTTNDNNTLYAMVREGLCVGALLDINVQHELQSGELVQLFPGKRFPGKRLYLVYAKQGVLPAKLKLFKDFIKAKFS